MKGSVVLLGFLEAHYPQAHVKVFAKRFCPKVAIRVSDEVVDCSNRAVKLSLTVFAQHAQHAGRFVYAHIASSLLEALYRTVNETGGMFYSHIYETDGFLLQLDGGVPKPVADQYGSVLERVIG